MRYVATALAALLLAATSAPAQQPEWADKLFAKGGLSHKFGNVPRGAVLSHRFTMTNIYAVPLQITGTRTSCGCVTVTPSVNALQPKETAHVDVMMDARRFTGPKSVSIYITVGPQFTSTATLQVEANSRADVVFNPGQVNFGVVAGGQAPTQTIDVEYAGALDWKITGVGESTNPIETRIEELYRKPGQVIQVGYRLSITLKAGAPSGSSRWELLLQTNDPASPTVPVMVEATVQAVLSVAPGRVNLGNVTVGTAKEYRVLLKGNKPFTVKGVEGAGEGLTVELPATGGANSQVATIRWLPEKAGNLKRELRFTTDLDGGAVGSVLIEGVAAPAEAPR